MDVEARVDSLRNFRAYEIACAARPAEASLLVAWARDLMRASFTLSNPDRLWARQLAFTKLTEARGLDPADREVLTQWAHASWAVSQARNHQELKRVREAISASREALRGVPGDGPTIAGLVDLLSAEGSLTGDIGLFQEAARLAKGRFVKPSGGVEESDQDRFVTWQQLLHEWGEHLARRDETFSACVEEFEAAKRERELSRRTNGTSQELPW